MAKRCPACGYAPIGPFTDNCPICAEPVRNVRGYAGGGSRSSGGGMTPVVKGVLIGAVVAVVAVVGCCGVGVWRMTNAVRDMQKQMEDAEAQAEADRQARTVVVAATDLLKEFEADPAAADRKYEGKYLELTGVVERVGQDRSETPFVILHAGDDGAKIKVECHFDRYDRTDPARVRKLTPGQTVTVRGEYEERISNVQLHECVLVP